MKKHKKIVTDEPTEGALEKPMIYWPCPGQTLTHFPSIRQLVEKNTYLSRLSNQYQQTDIENIAFSNFLNSIRRCNKLILIIDPYFFDSFSDDIHVSSFDLLARYIGKSDAQEIKIISNCDRIKIPDFISKLNIFKQYNHGLKCDIDIRGDLKYRKHTQLRVHDRFAVIDNELWHFGSNVGGISQGLTAISGPWSQKDTDAIKFFNELWESL